MEELEDDEEFVLNYEAITKKVLADPDSGSEVDGEFLKDMYVLQAHEEYCKEHNLSLDTPLRFKAYHEILNAAWAMQVIQNCLDMGLIRQIIGKDGELYYEKVNK